MQSLERLHAFALDAVDKTMLSWLPRTGKKTEALLPLALQFVTDMIRPLVDKIDTVHYTQLSRDLKVAEEYALRLLQPQYRDEEATRIARHLVEHYPEHGFIIDSEEAQTFGLNTEKPSEEQTKAIDLILPFLDQGPAIIGRLEKTDV